MALGDEDTQSKIDIALLRQDIRYLSDDVKAIKVQIGLLQTEITNGRNVNISGWSSWVIVFMGVLIGFAALFLSIFAAAR